MRNLRAIHEGFMNGSRTILPRVGVGGGVGVRGGDLGTAAFHLTVGADPRRPATRPPMQTSNLGGGL